MNHVVNYAVSGLSCQSCVDAIAKKLTDVDGIDDVTITLNSGGESIVSIASQRTIDDALAREVIDDAGFDVVGAPVTVSP